jgi:hypothetical protein
MTISSITTKATTALLTATLESSWVMIRSGQRCHEWLDSFERIPSALWRAQSRVVSMGEALEVGVERFAERLGVLDAVLDRVACAG